MSKDVLVCESCGETIKNRPVIGENDKVYCSKEHRDEHEEELRAIKEEFWGNHED